MSAECFISSYVPHKNSSLFPRQKADNHNRQLYLLDFIVVIY